MTVNFEIKDFSALIYNGQEIDMHDHFDFIGDEYKITTRELILKWIRSEDDGVKAYDFSNLELIHSNVSFLNISYNYKEYKFPKDDNCLSEVTFFPSVDRGTNDNFIDQRMPGEGDDIIYTFQSGHFIRVGCENIQLVAK
ncbi:MAG: hypothetical protein ABIN74_08480 [Ferruginibacter sp.]